MAVPTVEGRIGQAEVAGVPVWWADAPGPARAYVGFRVGRADETLATSGSTHLVEHLAMFGVGAESGQSGAHVDHVQTAFYRSGSSDEVAAFVKGVCASLDALPLERLALEKQVLLSEATTRSRAISEWLLRLRFGATGFGLLGFEELGLHRVGAEDLQAWASDRFSLGNAAVYLTGLTPDRLEIPLSAGSRHTPPALDEIPALRLPAYLPSSGGGVAVSFLGRRSTALTVGLALLEQRLHERLRVRAGLAYAPASAYLPLTGEAVHVLVTTDCLAEHATAVRDVLLDELGRFATDGPETDELGTEVTARLSRWADEDALVLSELHRAVANELDGAPKLSADEIRSEHRELTPRLVADAVAEIRATALLVAAGDDSASPTGFEPYETQSSRPLRGRRMLRRGPSALDHPRRSGLISANDGLATLNSASGRQVDIYFDDVAAVLEHRDGGLTLVATRGTQISIHPRRLFGGRKLEQRIREHIPQDRFVPLDGPVPLQTPPKVDRSYNGLARAYGPGLIAFLFGLQVFAHRSYALLPLLLGTIVLLRTYLRRRRRAAAIQAST